LTSAKTSLAILVTASLLLPLAATASEVTQDYGSRFGARLGDAVVFRLTGPTTLTDVIEPRLIKTYVPQELILEHSIRSWQYTNYADDQYYRYLNQTLWGDSFYDVYGHYLTRGNLVYSWTESHPRSVESSVITGGGFGSLIVSSDSRGGNAFSIVVGGSIFTSLTPLTFRKSVYNGTQMHFQSDRMQLTGLFSRISNPESLTGLPFPVNDYTNLVGGRLLVPVSDRATVGGVFLSAHNMRGDVESFDGNPFQGVVSSFQLERGVSTVVIRLTDDSPDDGVGGAVLVADDVEIITQIAGRDTVMLGSRVGFQPRRVGGIIRGGARVADGSDRIELRYDLESLRVLLDDVDAVNAIRDLRFRLILMNDYRVEVTSNQQTNNEDQPVFLPVTRAPGNIMDATNRKEIVFHYGVPTATQIAGLSLEVRDIFGFDLYTEYDVNHDYRKYPNSRYGSHSAHSGVQGHESDRAWILNLAKTSHPWDVSVETFAIDKDYNTSPFIIDGIGRVDYADSTQSLYDFVDDNDDNDRQPDQERHSQDARSSQEIGSDGRQRSGAADPAVFPGWDQNRDFISDFNQNDTFFRPNYVPDYDEPFLRYNVDHPDYLFGIDLNNNGWVDSFENDDEPDYPYKRDRQGYNAFLRYHPVPGLQITVGRVREQLISDDRRNITNYLLFGYENTFAGRGRVRVFQMTKRARDNIQEDLVQWVQQMELRGANVAIDDPLFARDAWINTLWLGYDYRSAEGPNVANIMKYDLVRQGRRGKAAGLESARLFGLVNKGDIPFRFDSLAIWPKVKSEFLVDDRSYSMAGLPRQRKQWTRIALIHLALSILHRTELQVGIERLYFSDYQLDEDTLTLGDLTNDYRSTVVAGQLKNRSDYLGYAMTTLFGISISHRTEERVGMVDRSEIDSTLFMTVYAGLRD